jgi:hypothetical protein
MPQDDHWLPGFNFNVEESDAEGLHCETLAICRTLAPARAVFAAAIAEKPAGSAEANGRNEERARPYNLPR